MPKPESLPLPKVAFMARNFATALVAKVDGAPILLFQAPKGTFRASWDVARAVEALKTRLPSQHLNLDIVVMDGEPTANAKLFGSSESTNYIRGVLAGIANPTLVWAPISID